MNDLNDKYGDVVNEMAFNSLHWYDIYKICISK
jgi:hypothetical protein